MKNSNILTLFCTGLLSFSTYALEYNADIYASDTQFERIAVEWVKPKSFRDVKDGAVSSQKFRKRVFNHLETHLDKLSQKLPDGQTVKFSITDLDLAGRVEPAAFSGLSRSMEEVRIMRDIDIPRINFEYKLLDKNRNVLKSGEVNLKDMSYLHNNKHIGRSEPYVYEKKMLTKWFEKSLIEI